MTASGSLAGSETPDDSDPWFGCFTGDCQHETQNGCNAAIRAEFARMERELHRIEAVAPSVESDPAPAHIAKFDKALGQMVFEPLPETAAPVAGIDVEATALAALLRDCADDREQEAHDSLAHTPEAFESFMADARRLRAHADALPSLVSGQADTGRLDWLEESGAETQREPNGFFIFDGGGGAIEIGRGATLREAIDAARVVPQDGGR